MLKQFETLSEFPVDPFNQEAIDQLEDSGPTFTTTYFFRQSSELPFVLGRTIDDANDPDRLRIISAGCSIGAEPYSVLGHLHQIGYDQPVAVMGLDANPVAAVTAQRAQFLVPRNLELQRRIYSEDGLDFEPLMAHHGLDIGESREVISLSAERLRDEAHTSFRIHDLADGLPTNKLANLILCNNVLPYFDPEAATAVVDDFADHLAEGGILSLGASTHFFAMEANKGMDYQQWCNDITKRLGHQGISRLVNSDVPEYVGFQRR
jgi:chemotaxis protein methyltransferase CheR